MSPRPEYGPEWRARIGPREAGASRGPIYTSPPIQRTNSLSHRPSSILRRSDASRFRTEPSSTVSPTWTTTPPMIAGSTVRCGTTSLPNTRESCCAIAVASGVVGLAAPPSRARGCGPRPRRRGSCTPRRSPGSASGGGACTSVWRKRSEESRHPIARTPCRAPRSSARADDLRRLEEEPQRRVLARSPSATSSSISPQPRRSSALLREREQRLGVVPGDRRRRASQRLAARRPASRWRGSSRRAAGSSPDRGSARSPCSAPAIARSTASRRSSRDARLTFSLSISCARDRACSLCSACACSISSVRTLLGRGAGVGDELLRLAARRVERGAVLARAAARLPRDRAWRRSIASSSACSRASTAAVIGPNANFDEDEREDDEDDQRPEHQPVVGRRAGRPGAALLPARAQERRRASEMSERTKQGAHRRIRNMK